MPSPSASYYTIDASPYTVSIPAGAIGGQYTPEEAQRLSETLSQAAWVANDPGESHRNHGSCWMRYPISPPMGGTFRAMLSTGPDHRAATTGCVGTGSDASVQTAWVSSLGCMYEADSLVEVEHEGCTADDAVRAREGGAA